MSMTSLEGVIAAVPTPIDTTGEPDTSAFLLHGQWALENGCDGLNVLGTTGEATSFSAAQRETVMRAASDNLDRSRLMVGTGTTDLATTLHLTRVAHAFGFAGALVLPPFYYKGISDDALANWFQAVVEGTSDALIPLYLYNFPQMTGLTFSPELVARLKAQHSERLVGAKDSSGDLAYAADLAKIPNFDVFPSNEAALARAETDGYAGCISATTNITGSMAQELWKDQENGALAERVLKARLNIAAQPLIPAIKYLVGQIHGQTGFERVLPPMLPLTDQQKASLARLI